MSEPLHDALIIGGGPGGSTAASYLARAGRRVLLLEKEHFPRFHIGESLLPYNRRLFEEIGVLPRLESEGLIRKFGAQFHSGNGRHSVQFVFRNGRFTREPQAFQVERARFDQILLEHARSCGADAREGWTVGRFETLPDRVAIEARNGAGDAKRFEARFLIDASGRSNLTGNQEGLREIHPRLKKLAVFGHFRTVRVDPGEKSGDTIIVRLDNKWFWLIPLSAEKVSVGCVLDQEEFQRLQLPPAAVFEQIWRASPAMCERMERAELIGAIQTTGDFSYKNRRFCGPRLLRVGDAAGFMDPIFSAGVYLAMYSARRASQAVMASLDADDDGTARFAQYERRVHSAMSAYWGMVERFYTNEFMDFFFAPQEHFKLASAVNAMLAGELEGGWALRWRMNLFFLLIRLQRRFQIVPRASLA